ncbi:hypothetical protein [Fluviispira vulneris]|uniref:hypothetical protein n=1 Tax=Fluviispira vulneris TaxID=2763012 RepID=UPI001644FDEF|nr:hypothetical protein [Fluviispira vulneris]
MYANPIDNVKWFRALLKNNFAQGNRQITPQFFSSIDNAAQLKSFAFIGYNAGLFTMPTPLGVLWFTPGMTPGFVSLVGMFPCNGIFFSYSASNFPQKKGFHPFFLDEIFKILKTDLSVLTIVKKYKSQTILPQFCQSDATVSKTEFPKF